MDALVDWLDILENANVIDIAVTIEDNHIQVAQVHFYFQGAAKEISEVKESAVSEDFD